MTFTRPLIPLAAGLALVGCGGGGGGTAPSAFTIGSEGSVASNGLDYASLATTRADLDEKVVKMLFVYTISDSGNDTTRILLSEEQLSLPAEFSEQLEFDQSLKATFQGDIYVFANGTAAEGDTALSFLLSADGTYGGMVNMYGSLADGTDMDGMSVVGFQTDPSEIADLKTEVTFVGYAYGWGNFTGLGGEIVDELTSVNFDVTLSANFASGMVDGTLTTTDLYAYSDAGLMEVYPNATLAFETDIDGNGFTADMSVSCDGGIVCTGGGELGGVFFGPDAAEVGGVYAFDVTVTDPGYPDGALRAQHPGAFYAIPD